MGRKESRRLDHREKVSELINSGRDLSPEEIAFIKAAYTGVGGLVRSDWSHGQFFTPPEVVSFVHGLIGTTANPGTLIEPSCGGGAFLEGLDHSLCTAIEPHRETHQVARICYPGATIICSTAEEMFPPEGPCGMDGTFDYCVGNPPFGLKTRWTSPLTKNRPSIMPSEQVFMEIAYRAVKPMGKIAMVVPDGLLSSASARPLREWLMSNCYIRAVVSLPRETFFHAGTTVKTSVLYLQKFPIQMQGADPRAIADYKIFMAIAEDIGWDSRGRKTKGNDLDEVLCQWKTFGHPQTAHTEPCAQAHGARGKDTAAEMPWQPTLF